MSMHPVPGQLPPWNNERPSLSEARAWFLAARPALKPDWHAMITGAAARSLISYAPRAVPAPLAVAPPPPAVAPAGPSGTPAQVAARDLLIVQITEENVIRAEQRAAHEAEIRNDFFMALDSSLRFGAPLLLASLTAAHPLAYNAAWHDGQAAWDTLYDRFVGVHAVALRGEDDMHDDYMVALRLKPLLENCTAEEFASRVNVALNDHIPFLVRPFPAGPSQGRWVIDQLPAALSADGRRLLDSLTPAQLADSHHVASRCVEIVSAAHVPDLKVVGPLAPFLGAIVPVPGRRPKGLATKGDPSGKKPGARTDTAGASKKPADASERGKCSVKPPRGPMCRFGHSGPCFRDPLFAGPLPRATWDDSDRMARIVSDRLANATRLKEVAVPLKPPADAVEGAVLIGAVCGTPSDISSTSHAVPDTYLMFPIHPKLFAALVLDALRCYALSLSHALTYQVHVGQVIELYAEQESVLVLVSSSQFYPSVGVAWSRLTASLIPPAVCHITSASAAESFYADSELDASLSHHPTWFDSAVHVLHIRRATPAHLKRVPPAGSAVVAPTAPPAPYRLPAQYPPAVRPLEASLPSSHVVRNAIDTGADDSDEDAYASPTAHFRSSVMRWTFVLLSLMAVGGVTAIAFAAGFVSEAYTWVVDTWPSTRDISFDQAWMRELVGDVGVPHRGVLWTAVVLLLGPLRGLHLLLRAVRQLSQNVRRHALSAVLVVFIWVYVARASALSPDDVIAFRSVMREHSSHTCVSAHFALASSTFVRFTRTYILPPTSTSVVDVFQAHISPIADSDIVLDSGAMRSVFRRPDWFIASTKRPCPFMVRGVDGMAIQPAFIGDARVPLCAVDDSTVFILVKEAVCLAACPHDLLSCGQLLRDGARIELGGTSVLRLATGECIPVRNADVLLLRAGSPSACYTAGVSASPRIRTHMSALYLCSNVAGKQGSFGSCWRDLGGSVCSEYDVVNSAAHDLTDASVRDDILRDIRAGVYDVLLASPPCNTFSVVRFLFQQGYPVLRTREHILGIPGLYALEPRFSVRVIAANAVTDFVAEACEAMHATGRPFVVENPVARGLRSGPWAEYYADKFSEHGSFWQMPSIVRMLHSTSAILAHVPLCFWGASRRHDVTLAMSPSLSGVANRLQQARCTHTSHAGSIRGDTPPNVDSLRLDGEYPPSFCSDLARLLRDPMSPSPLSPASSAISHSDVLAGLPGDKNLRADDAVIKGRRQKQSSVTSMELHRTFGHASATVLRHLPDTAADAPELWRHMADDTCDACLRAKATRLHSARAHTCTVAGEIMSLDLWSCRVPCIVGGEHYILGARCNATGWAYFVKLKFKTGVPDALRHVLAVCSAHGVSVRRFHTDNENIFHTTDARDATVSQLRTQGILFTTGCEYESNQNSIIERHWRTCCADARAGMSVWGAGEGFLMLAMVDAAEKRNVIPYSDDHSSCPHLSFTGTKPNVAQFRPFGCEVHMFLQHELNDSRVRVGKGADRAVRGLCLTYGRDGTVGDRHRPGWGVLVPAYRYNKLLFSSHCTFHKNVFPGIDGVRDPPPPLPPTAPESVRIAEDGGVLEAEPIDAGNDEDDGYRTPTVLGDTAARVLDPQTAVQQGVPMSRRLPPRSASGITSHRGIGVACDVHVPSHVLGLEADLLAAVYADAPDRALVVGLSTHPSCADTPRDVEDIERWPALAVTPSSVVAEPRPGTSSTSVAQGSRSSAPASESARLAARVLAAPPTPSACVDATPPLARTVPADEPAWVLASFVRPGAAISVDRPLLLGSAPSPDVDVEFPWGTVPHSDASGFAGVSMPYESGIDQTVFASYDDLDDPHWHEAMRGNERDQWRDAFWSEIRNLQNFGVIGSLVPADAVPHDRDIYDTIAVCKRKRGKDNVMTKHKVRICLNGRQMNQSSAAGDLRTCAPTLMHRSFKMGCAAAACKRARRVTWDVTGAYLQGKHKEGYVVYSRAPLDARTYDERGVELVWVLVGPLYGEPDAGRVWYNTFSHWILTEEHFTRSVGDPCHFFKRFSDGTDIQLDLYVDDGSTFDTNAAECDAFLARLAKRFVITVAPDDFYLGMDIFSPSPGVIKLSSETYIMSLVHRELADDLASYKRYDTPADSRLLEYYEAAVTLRAVPDKAFHVRYRSLVGGLCWIGPTTRPDILYATGICARAFTFPTVELYGCAVRILLYCAHTASLGITFSGNGPNPSVLSAASDSDWSTLRSTSGGCLLLAGGCVLAVSRKQDCVTTSTAHAEIVSASSLSSDVVHARLFCDDLGIKQVAPTIFDVDNKAVYDVSRNYTATKNLRHLDRRAFRIRELSFASVLAVRLVASAANYADIFTKPLDRQPFYKFRRVLLNIADAATQFMHVFGFFRVRLSAA